jgi:hypothetical protein
MPMPPQWGLVTSTPAAYVEQDACEGQGDFDGVEGPSVSRIISAVDQRLG